LIGTVLKFATDFVTSFIGTNAEEFPPEIAKIIEPSEQESGCKLMDVESDFSS
jgi:quinol monooxygenase YgiN